MKKFIIIPAIAMGLAIPTSATISTSTALACTKAHIGGQTKCLQRGQFCSPSKKRQYKRYGFRCVRLHLR